MSQVHVTHVWSSYGHRFMSTDAAGHKSCLTCGATFELVADADDPTWGAYRAFNGNEPRPCSGNTSQVHGYAGEVESVENWDSECNCLGCDS